MKLPIHTAVISHDEGATQYVSASHGELIERIGGWCREHWPSVSDDPPPQNTRDLIDAYFLENPQDLLDVFEDSMDLPEPYASALALLDVVKAALALPAVRKAMDDYDACRWHDTQLRDVANTASALITNVILPPNGTEPLKVGDRVRIAPAWQDPGDGQYERIVIEAPVDSTRVLIRTLIPDMSIQPTEWIEASMLVHPPTINL